jgi:hypothetical protein
MNKEFIPYEEALALKELGFDEPCFGYYVGLGDNKETPFKLIQIQSEKEQFKWVDNVCHAPLYQQAFRWFAEKYKIEGIPQRADERKWYKFRIYELYEDCKIVISAELYFNSYEEAQLGCLKKLINIIKNK